MLSDILAIMAIAFGGLAAYNFVGMANGKTAEDRMTSSWLVCFWLCLMALAIICGFISMVFD